MAREKLEAAVARITSLAVFQDVLQRIRAADSTMADNIESTLRQSLKPSEAVISRAGDNGDTLRYGLYRQATELQTYIKPYQRLTETMAQREKALWTHAFHCTEKFFEDVTRALDVYFGKKLEAMKKDINEDASWYSGIRDTARKGGDLLNLGRRGVAKIANLVREGTMTEEQLLDSRSVVERTLNEHLDQEQVAKDVEAVLAAATEPFSEAWRKVIETQTPDLRDLRAFAGVGTQRSVFNVGFELGAAEGTLLIGVGGAVAGSIGLATGWHTITYALLNVFPPAAAFAVFATVLVAVFTKDRAKQKRLDTVRKAVEQYFRTLLTLVNTEKIEELHDKTLREAMHEQSERIIGSTLDRWTRAICGGVPLDLYRTLAAAADEHLLLINDCLVELDTNVGRISTDTG